MPEINGLPSFNNISPKRLLIIGAIVAVYTGLLFALSYWFFEKSGKFEPQTKTEYITRTVTKESSPSAREATSSANKDLNYYKPIETAKVEDWKTLKGEKDNFSVQYPPSYSVTQKPVKNGNRYRFESSDYKIKSLGHCPWVEEGALFYVSVGNFAYHGNSDRYTEFIQLQEHVVNNYYHLKKYVLIDGQKGVRFIIKGPAAIGSSFSTCSLVNDKLMLERVVFLDKKENFFTIEMGYNIDETKNYADTLHKMLSTFRLLD